MDGFHGVSPGFLAKAAKFGRKKLEFLAGGADKTIMGILSTALGALHGAENKLDRTATRLAKLDQTKPDASGDTVDLSTEMVNLMSARNEYEANLKSIQTSEEMSRRTLDILA